MADEKILIQIEVDNDKAVKALERQNKEIDDLEKSQKKLRDEGKKNTKEYQLQAQQLTKLNSERKNTVNGIKSETNTLGRMKARLREVTIAIDKQDLSTKKGQQSIKALREEQNRLNTTLKKSEASGGSFSRNVGNYGNSLQSAIPQIQGFNLALLANPYLLVGAALAGLTAQVFAFGRTFDTSMSKVQAVTGATSKEMEDLRDSAIELGESSKFTATEVANLQVELGKLGFTTKEIEESTAAIIDLATATDSDLARSAEVAASTLKQFGKGTEETTDVVDVMAASFSSSALDIEKFATSMAIVGPAGDAVGASLESVTAILAKTADAGIDASTSGSALRNIFIDLSDKGLSWEDAITKINESQNKLQTANDLFGKRGAVVASVIAQNAEGIRELDVAFQNAAGSAKEMADIVSNNLQGDLDRLSSSWEGLIARLSSGGGKAFRYFIVTIQFGIDLLKQLGANAVLLLNPAGTMAVLFANFATDIANAFDKVVIIMKEGYIELLRTAKSAKKALGLDTSGLLKDILKEREDIYQLNKQIEDREQKEETRRQEEGLSAYEKYKENLARIDKEYEDKKKAQEIKANNAGGLTNIETTEDEENANQLAPTEEQFSLAVDGWSNFLSTVDKLKNDYAKKQKKRDDEEKRRDLALANAKLGLASTVLRGVSQFLEQGSAEQKAFAITEAGINTAKGVTNALAYGAPPLNTINALAVGAAGAVQVAKIMSTTPGSSSGGGGGGSVSTQSTAPPQANTNAIDQQLAQQQALIEATNNIGMTVSVTEINEVQSNVALSEQTATI